MARVTVQDHDFALASYRRDRFRPLRSHRVVL